MANRILVLLILAGALSASGPVAARPVFTEDFETGSISPEKWYSWLDPDTSEIKVVPDPRGKGHCCYFSVSTTSPANIWTKDVFGDIPYILEFEWVLAPQKESREWADVDKRGAGGKVWGLRQLGESAAYLWTNYDSPTLNGERFTGGAPGEWTKMNLEDDTGEIIVNGVGGGRSFRFQRKYDCGKGTVGALAFGSFGQGCPPKKEFLLDNISVRYKPMAERRDFIRRMSEHQQLVQVFKGKEIEGAGAAGPAGILSETAAVLKGLAGLPDDANEQYRERLKKVDCLLAEARSIYHAAEYRLAGRSFPGNGEFVPVDLASCYNGSEPARPSELDTTAVVVRVDNIPFMVSPVSPNVVLMDMGTENEIPIAVGRKAGRVFLLLKMDFQIADSDREGYTDDPAWFKQESENFADGLLLRVDYRDGTSEKVFPRCVSTGKYVFRREVLDVYSFTPAWPKTIERIVLLDKSPILGGCLYAVTLGSRRPAAGKSPGRAKGLRAVDRNREARIEAKGGMAVVETGFYRLRFSTRDSLLLEEFTNKYTGENYLEGGNSPLIMTAGFKQSPVMKNWRVVSAQATGNSLSFRLESVNLSACLDVTPSGDEILLDFRMRNESGSPREETTLFPVIKNLNLDGYFYPWRSGVCSTRDADFVYGYGGVAWMEWLAGWDAGERAGFSLRTEDKDGWGKILRVIKQSGDADPPPGHGNLAPYAADAGANRGMLFSVQYICVPLGPSQEFQFPRCVLAVHPGAWKEGFTRYRRYIRTWWKNLRPCPDAFRYGAHISDVGTPSDPEGRRKGKTDIAHHGWFWTADYPAEMLKKLPLLEQDAARDKAGGIGTGLYLESLLLERDHRLAADFGAKWAMKDERGEPRTYEGNAYMMCPGVAAWREQLGNIYRIFADKIPLVEVYQDCLGFCGTELCFDRTHGHAAPAEWVRDTAGLFDNTRRSVLEASPATAVISEGPGCEYMMMHEDGSWCNMHGILSRDDFNPGRLCFLHFVLPEFKMYTIKDSVGDLKMGLFNGLGVSSRYGGYRSWDLLRRFVPVMRDLGDVFNCGEAEPALDTGCRDIWLNRFGSGNMGKLVYAAANWGYRTGRASLNLDYFDGAHYVDLTGFRELAYRARGDKAAVEMSLDPREVVYIGCFRKIMEVKARDGIVRLGLRSVVANPAVRIELVSKSRWESRNLPLREDYDLRRIFAGAVGEKADQPKLVIKLFDGKFLADEAILDFKRRD